MKNLEQGKSELKRHARLFFALWPPGSLQGKLHGLAQRYQKQCGGRVMRAESIHLTLLFLGETPLERVGLLQNAAGAINAKSFELVLDRIAGWRHNGIGFAAPAPNDVLVELAQQLRSRVAQADFRFDGRAFTPHITLLRKMDQARGETPIDPMTWRVEEFVLVESEPVAGGVRYSIIGRWPLSHPAHIQTSRSSG